MTVGVAALVVALAGCVSDSSDDAPPAAATAPTATPTTTPTPPPYPAPVRARVVTARWHHPDYLAAASAPHLEVTDPVPLAADPVRRAVLAVVPSPVGLRGDARWTTIAIQGVDGRWRSVDVPGLQPTRDGGGYEWYPLSPTSLSDDGTRLALAQPDGLVIVDLTTGRHRHYDVPGLNKSAVWRDDSHVLLEVEERSTMREVDLDTGAVVRTDVDPSTRFLPNGGWVSWPQAAPLVTSTGPVSTAAVGNSGGIQRTVPLADARVVVGLAGSGMRTGPVVVDLANGDVLGFRTGMISKGDLTQLLGLDDHSVLMSIVQPRALDRLLIRWDWAEKRSEVVATLAAQMASWAGPVAEAATMVR